MGAIVSWLIKLAHAVGMTIALSQPFHGLGTKFSPPSIDPSNTGTDTDNLACLARDRPNAAARQLMWKGSIVAHRTLPCMTEILLCVDRTQRCERAVVADWGPMHADIDIFYQLANRLRHNGMETVTWSVLGSLSAKKGKQMKAPATEEGIKLYGVLKEAVATAKKGVVKKAVRIMMEFECGFVGESIFISRARSLLGIESED